MNIDCRSEEHNARRHQRVICESRNESQECRTCRDLS